MELNQIYNEDCIEGMKRIPDASIDVILTDPPYKYLPEDFDRDFDEGAFFKEADRVLKPDGWIILFGRGTSFYRWNTRLAEIGYHFKEEIIWDKCYNSSPTAVLQRFHETISVHCKGTASIRKCRVPYMEKRVPDTDKIISDIKRLSVILHNPTELASVEDYLRTGNLEYFGTNRPMGITVQATLPSPSRCASVARSMKEGLLEASIIKIRRDITTQSIRPRNPSDCSKGFSISSFPNRRESSSTRSAAAVPPPLPARIRDGTSSASR